MLLDEQAPSTMVPSTTTSNCHKRLSFTPSASIINYYTTKSVMGGHVDDLELAMDKPIVSISLGLPAIFILGGTTREEEPVVSILLRPGDVLCMGGRSRLNYHAMARVIPYEAAMDLMTTTEGGGLGVGRKQLHEHQVTTALWDPQQALQHESHRIPEEDQAYLDEYLRNHRININVRQVYPDSDGAEDE
jgi:alkylated DNA repair protein alkB family protein 1